MRGNKAIKLTGKRFGRWRVLNRAPKVRRSDEVSYYCRCICGVEKVVSSANLRYGVSISCGCVNFKKKLSRAKVLVIRSAYDNRFSTKAELARRFSVSFACISSVVSRETWKHV